MNNTYRLVWNASLGLWQAAPETARGRGKSKAGRALRPLLASAALALSCSALAAPLLAVPVLPTGGSVVAGDGTITQSGNTTTIEQATSKLAIDWQSFSIGQGGTVIFRQPSTTSVALNRVLGADPSLIQGALRSNGQVFLLNPNGVLFSPSAQVDTGGLLASTLEMKTADFLDGRYALEGASAQAVVNQGALRAASGGSVALVAARVTNAGTIDAPEGSVVLGAGSQVLLDLGGPVKLQLQKAAVDTLVENGGAIRADGGTVLLTAKAASELAGSVINQGGTIRARTLASGKQGEILLLGDMTHGALNVGGTLDASAPTSGNGGFIETSAAHVTTAQGLVVDAGAAQGKGGQWLVDPYDYLINATAATNIAASLNTGTSVTITTQASNPQYGGGAAGSGDITVASAINKSAGGDATLTLKADRNVIVGADIGATSGKLGIVLNAGNGGGAFGGVRVNGNLRSNGGDILIGGARGTANQGIGYAANLNGSEAAVVVEQSKAILSSGGNITINGRSTVGSNNGSYGGVTGGVYIKSGAQILSGTGDLYITGESSAGLKTFGIAFEAASGTKTILGSATNGGNMLMNAVNSSAGTAAEQDAGAMGMVNYGSVGRLSFYGPSVASWLVFINGVPQLSGYTRTPQLNCAAGYLNCGYLVVPGSNNSYLYAGYESVSLATKAAYVIQSGAGTKVYDGSTLATGLTLSALGGPTGFTPASLQPAPLFHTTSKNVGTYTRLVRDAANPTSLVSGADTYAVGYFNSGTYQITPRALTPTVTSRVYDGTSTAAVTATGVIGSDDVHLRGVGSFGGTGVGLYNNVSASGITLDGLDAGNYTLGSNTVASMSASILPREVTLTAQKTYDGTAALGGALVIGNLVPGEQLSYSGAAANSLHVDGATHVSAVTLADGSNGAAANYVLPSLAGASSANSAAITPRVLSVQATGAAPSKTYDGTVAAPAGFQPAYAIGGLAAADSGATVSVGATGIAYNSANVRDADRLIVSGMSVAGVSGGVANARDYVLDASSRNVAATIAARPLSVAVDNASKTYGNSDPALGYRVTAGSLVGSDTLSGTLTRVAGENVGSYAIDGSALANGNYLVSVQNGVLTVTPRALSVVFDALGKTYGETDPLLAYRLTAGSLVGSDTLGVTRTGGENVGSYALTASASPNYTLSVTPGAFSIRPRALTVAVDNQAKTYGDSDPALGYRVTAGSLVGSDTLSGAVTRVAGENVGSYAIDGSALANGNYLVSVQNGVLTVTPRALSVVFDTLGKTYGETDPLLAYRLTAGSLVGSDTLGVTRTGGENVGSYALTASASPNYTLSVTPGALSIRPRALTVAVENASKTYGDSDPALGYRIASGSLVGNDTLSGALTRAAGENVGSYAIDGSALANGNYLVSVQNGVLTVTPRALSVVFDALGKTYGETDPLLAYRLTAGSLVGSDTLGVTRTGGENVGSYALTASASPNYTLSVTPGAFSIRPRALTVAVDNKAKTYGDSDPALGYRIASGSLVGSDKLIGALTRAAGENVGSYAIDGSSLANGNYVLTVNNGTLAIAPRAIGVSADAAAKVVGETDPRLTWRLSSGSLIGNDTLAGQLARSAGEAAGSYAIGQGTLGNSNYAIAYTSATLQIAAATVVAQPVVTTPAPVVVTPAPVVATPAPVVETPVPVVVTPAPVVVMPAPVAETPVVATPAPVVVTPAPVIDTPVAIMPTPVIAPVAPVNTAVLASAYTTIVPEMVPPTVGALSYVAVAERSTEGQTDEKTTQERAASHAPTSGREVKFLDVMVVSGGINTGATLATPASPMTATPAAR